MDLVPSLAGASDESCVEQSSGPSTPISNPLFCTSVPNDIVVKGLVHAFNDFSQLRLDSCDSRSDSLSSDRFALPRPLRKICFIGAGYVGGPTATVIALHNPSLSVEVLDRDESRIKRWKSSHIPIHEPGLEHLVRLTRDGANVTPKIQPSFASDTSTHSETPSLDRPPNLTFTTDSKPSISQAEIIFLGVNTSTKTHGIGAGRATDMSALDGAVRDIAKYARSGTIIVEKSTVPCGTANRIRSMLETSRPGDKFEVLSNPEFLAEGSAVRNLLEPDRVIIGSSNTFSGRSAARILADIYAAWVPRSKIVEINVFSAELSKLTANAMLAQRISSMNAISAICDATGADVDEIAASIGLDPRIGSKFLNAGLGFGGSCFRKDIASLVYLAESLGLDEVAHYWDQVNSMNNSQRHRFTRKVIQALDGNLVRKKVAMLGFAFKPATGDARESPAVDVIKTLLSERPAEIAIFDQFCTVEDIRREIDAICASELHANGGATSINIYPDPYQACADADAVLVITPCDQFRCLPTQDWEASLGSVEAAHKRSRLETSAHDDLIYSNGLHYQLSPRPLCPLDCRDCKSTSKDPLFLEQLEWARIAYNMKQPRWVLDGRGILNITEMEKLGFKVVTLGRQALDGRSYC